MVDFTHAHIEKLVIHKIGNKSTDEGIQLSKSEILLHDKNISDILLTYFSHSCKSEDFYKFNDNAEHEESVQASAQQIFQSHQEFYVHSANIAQLLYDASNHPNIKPGELYVAYFTGCVINDEETDAVGIFKSENKDSYIKIYQENDRFDVEHEQGINIKKLDKGCLIFNSDADSGYILKIVDNTNKNNEAAYWRNDFINAKIIENNYFNTQNFMQLCKNFSQEILTEDNNVTKQEQLAFMSKSVDYLNKNQFFDIEQFSNEVIGSDEVIEHFTDYKQEFEEERNITPQSHFEVSPDALKKAKKYMRSIIKLDKNFHIYVHSRPEFIEKGFDQSRNMHFYKLFFESEN